MQTLKRKDVQIKLRLVSSQVVTAEQKSGNIKGVAEKPYKPRYL